MTRFGLTKLDTMAKEKFRVCEHIMPGDVEISINGGFKQEHVGSCRSTTKNITTTMPMASKYDGVVP